VRLVSASDEPWAAIGTLRAADLYGCEVIAADIEDARDNSTRFVLIGREPAPALGPGRFKTTVVCALRRDRPGALLAILQELAMRAVNLTKLESRPLRLLHRRRGQPGAGPRRRRRPDRGAGAGRRRRALPGVVPG
jgi:prephenate dehydratase